MPLLFEHPIHAEDWARETAKRNGHALAPSATPSKVEDAGRWEPAVQKIVSFQHLDDDWDGFGAEAPSRAVLESAIGLAYCFLEDGVDPPHRVVVSVAGEIIFEWQDPDGTYTEVEIDRPLHAEVIVIQPGRPAEFRDIPERPGQPRRHSHAKLAGLPGE